ncbi:MAG: C4-type zinc ribbon domain-containing protein [Bacteroidota bacterium]|nr:C4-type zinc ribbon domain-containing protein [Bacteroidota bacterium]
MAKTTKTKKKVSTSAKDKLQFLYKLQLIDSGIDSVRIVRGELPIEIQQLEDQITHLDTKVQNGNNELTAIEEEQISYKETIKNAKALVKKYKKQLENIKNNREFISLTKEVEFQTLEIELSEKKIKEADAKLSIKNDTVKIIKSEKKDKNTELKIKTEELDSIVKETEKDEKSLLRKSTNAQKNIDEGLLNLYHRIREKVTNGLAVVSIERNACGGCFNTIPPQKQLDIGIHKEIVFCEHCGRILVDSETL